MTFPLIQQPGPFTKLAQVVQGLRQRAEERRAAEAERTTQGLQQQLLGQQVEGAGLANLQTRDTTARERVTRQQTAAGIARLVQAQPDPTSERFGELARQILADTSDPDAIEQIGRYYETYTQLHQLGPEAAVRALRLEGERDQLGLAAAERTLQHRTLADINTVLDDPAVRRVYAQIKAGLGDYLIEQMRTRAARSGTNAQLDMASRQAAIQTLTDASAAFRQAVAAYGRGEAYVTYDASGGAVDVPALTPTERVQGSRRTAPREDYFIAHYLNRVGLTPADLRVLGASLVRGAATRR